MGEPAAPVQRSQLPILDPEHRLLFLPVDCITANPTMPRRHVNEKALTSLAESIERWGQLQPVVVRCRGDHYELICGERRWLAHKRAGLRTIWAIERDVVDSESLVLALIENLQRVGLSHAEKVAALDQLSELSQVEGLRHLARQLHVTPGWLSSQLAVRRDPVIFPALDAGHIGLGQAAEMMRAPAQARAQLLQRVLSEPGHVATATIRKWAAEMRAPDVQQVSTSQATEDVREHTHARLAEQVERLSPPQTAAEREALKRIIAHARQLLRLTTREGQTDVSQRRLTRKTTSTEVTCLLCGQQAGHLEETRTFQPLHDHAVRIARERLACGNCGGALTYGARTERFSYLNQ
jgi:ParB family chromosome partitioning protein